jgi:hypothetical protein
MQGKAPKGAALAAGHTLYLLNRFDGKTSMHSRHWCLLAWDQNAFNWSHRGAKDLFDIGSAWQRPPPQTTCVATTVSQGISHGTQNLPAHAEAAAAESFLCPTAEIATMCTSSF